MTRTFRISWHFLLACAVAISCAIPASAQTITTGSLSLTVEDQQGGRLPGVTVQATHVATGTTYDAVTQSDGRVSILNVRVGLYTVKVTMSGFRAQELKDVPVGLGEDRLLQVKLGLQTVAETVTVVGGAQQIDLTRAGTAGNISSEVKELLPTISRSLVDVVRTNVYFNPMGVNEDAPAASVAGRSQRYNNIQIDGAVNNDLFGLAAGAGVPGGSAGTQPISLDAIQEIQLVVSPYDIRQSGFSGGGINAITKTGTNDIHGSVFMFGRNQAWVGKGITRVPISTFKDMQTGFSVGGPIMKNRAFFFGTLDSGRNDLPAGFSVNGTGVKYNGSEALVDQFISDLKNIYGYDLGANAKAEVTRKQNNDKLFLRSDFNYKNSQVTVRHNFVDAYKDNGFPSATAYVFPDGFHRFNSRTNSTVGQVTSRFGAAVNELRVALTTVRERRDPSPNYPNAFPRVTVTIGTGLTLLAGLDGASQRNQLDQDILEITNDYTRVRGKHQFTLGTHNEFFKFRNLFINGANGVWAFSSLANFETGVAQSFSTAYSATNDPMQSAKFRVNHMGFYAGDQWRAMPRLTVTGGVRVDFVRYPTKPNPNPVSVASFGYRTDVVPENTMFAPRAGFNYALKTDGTEQVRGGLGLFSGRTPYVWISNQFGNTGVDFIRLSATTAATTPAFVADPNNQPKTLASGPLTNEIDVIDPNFKYPSVLRGNIAYDRKLPFGIYSTAEFVMTSVVHDIRYANLNLRASGVSPIDGRPLYTRDVNPSLTDVILLTNADQGHAWTMSFDLKRNFRSGWFVNGSYLYGQSTSIADGVRDQAVSGWSNIYTPGDPNSPALGRSDYDPGHRITLTTSYDFKMIKGIRGTASVFYSGQSGRPYSLLVGSSAATGQTNFSANGDLQSLNDLMFLYAQQGTLNVTNGTFNDLLNFFNNHECTAKQLGSFMERNSCRSPWVNTMDVRLAFKLPVRNKISAEVTLDMLNFINFLDHDRGLFRYANFNDVIPANVSIAGGAITGLSLANGLAAGTFNEYTRSDLRSRWQLQLGGRIRF